MLNKYMLQLAKYYYRKININSPNELIIDCFNKLHKINEFFQLSFNDLLNIDDTIIDNQHYIYLCQNIIDNIDYDIFNNYDTNYDTKDNEIFYYIIHSINDNLPKKNNKDIIMTLMRLNIINDLYNIKNDNKIEINSDINLIEYYELCNYLNQQIKKKNKIKYYHTFYEYINNMLIFE